MDFKLPDIGEGVHEGEITRWLLKEGDTVKADQPMVEVMTDKATVEIPSPVSGTIEKTFAKEGETIEVGKVLVRITEASKASDAPTAPPTPTPPSKKVVPPAPEKTGPSPKAKEPKPLTREVEEVEVLPFPILATPATRKLARDLSVDLKNIKGTGPHGRITKLDVQLVYEGHQASAPRTSHPVASAQTLPSTRVSRGQLQRVPLKGIRKRIAEAMAISKHTAAHFTYVDEVDMTEVVKLRQGALEEASKRNIKLTYLPFIIKAVVPALMEFPYLNSSLDEEKQEVLLKGEYNIGIATDTLQGLMVPVIKNADRKNIWELAQEIEELSGRARAGKSSLEDLKGGTFTLTNAGSIGGVFATPIINYPEVAILGINAIRKRPVVLSDEIVIRDMMFLSISVDHRVVDGADAARFINRLVYFLSVPARLVFS